MARTYWQHRLTTACVRVMCCLVVGLSSVLLLAPASVYAQDDHAKEGGADPALDALRTSLAAASAANVWAGYLKKLAELPEARRVDANEAVLVPILNGSEPALSKDPEQSIKLRAAVAQHVMLEIGDEYRNAALDIALVHALATDDVCKAVRKTLPINPDTQRRAGWDRMLAKTTEQAMVDHSGLQLMAILMQEIDHAREIEVLPALMHKRFEVTFQKEPAKTHALVVSAFDRILSLRFASSSEARSWFDDQKFGAWEDWSSWTAEQRYENEARLRRAADDVENESVDKGSLDPLVQFLTDAIAKADLDGLGALSSVWRLKGYWAERIQKAAIKRAKELDLKPDAQGLALLSSVFELISDPLVMSTAIEILNRWTVPERTPATVELAEQMVKRLAEAKGLTVETRLALIQFVGALGGAAPVVTALKDAGQRIDRGPANERGARVQYYVACIESLASVDGVQVAMLAGPYSNKAPVVVRVAVMGGLSSRKIRENVDQRASALVMLLDVLQDGPDGTSPRDEALEVRLAALSSLGFFHKSESEVTSAAIPVLATYLSGSDEEAHAAVGSLIRHVRLAKSVAAADALAAGLASYSDKPPREAAALAALAAATELTSSPALAKAVRDVLSAEPPRPQETRERALATSILLADAHALPTITAEWVAADAALAKVATGEDAAAKEAAQTTLARWSVGAQALVTAVAKATGEDRTALGVIADHLAEMTNTAEGAVRATTLLDAMEETADGVEIYLVRARLYALTASNLTNEPAKRLSAAKQAIALLAKLKASNMQERSRPLRYELHALQGDLETGDDTRAQAYLKACGYAVAHKDADGGELARQARDKILPKLTALSLNLTKDQQNEVAKVDTEVNAAAGG